MYTNVYFPVRCGVCRRRSWKSSSYSSQGRAPYLGTLYVYTDHRVTDLGRGGSFALDGWVYQDVRLDMSFERATRLDGKSHELRKIEAVRLGEIKPKRTQAEKFLFQAASAAGISGRPVGSELRARCPKRHRINEHRMHVEAAVLRSRAGDTLYFG